MSNINPVFLICVIAGLIILCLWLFYQWGKECTRSGNLEREKKDINEKAVSFETNQLKFQLQPHTLRNVIASLHVASKNLYKGTESLANMLDYVLYNEDRQLVSIEEEVEFLNNYQTLQSRFVYQAQSLQIDTSGINASSTHYKTPCIPHLITGYFVENAFKHGDLNSIGSMKVRLALTEDQFRFEVENRFVPGNDKGTKGIGLENMKKRLELLHPGRFELVQKVENNLFYSSLMINL